MNYNRYWRATNGRHDRVKKHSAAWHRAECERQQNDYNGQMLKEVSHNHEAFVTEWTPGVNDMVLCIMVPDGDGDGFIIGEV